MSIANLIYKLTKQNALLPEQLLAAIPAHVYWKNKDGAYLFCNDAQAKTWGCSNSKDVIGKTDFDLLDKGPQSIEAIRLRENDLRIMESGKQETIEERVFICGENRTYLSQKTPIRNKTNDVIGILGVSIEITKRKNAELELLNAKNNAETANQAKTDFLEQLLLEMPAHVYWKDKDGVYLGCNDTQALTIGFKTGKEVIGKTDFDLPWSEEFAKICRNNDISIMEAGEKRVIEESAIIDGIPITLLGLKTPLKNKQKDIIGILGISVDITERKQMEQALTIAKEKAEFANNTKMEFLQNMRHDFRTPFCGILGMAQILHEEATDPQTKDLLNDIVNSAQILLDQLSQMTDFISIEDKELAILAKQFDLYKVITDIEKMLLPAAKEKQIKFTIDIGKDVPQYVIGDMLRTQRILLNLLANAVKFTNIGHVAFTASVGEIENKNVIIKFKIEDTGIGIPLEQQNVIFEKFTRLSPSYKGIYPGNGLGLKIVKQFVEELGGEVHVNSKFGKGSTFVVLIPCKLPLLGCDEKEL